MKKFKLNKKGFSLIELAIACTMTTFFAGICVGTYVNYLDNIDETTSKITSEVKRTRELGLTISHDLGLSNKPNIVIDSKQMTTMNMDTENHVISRSLWYAKDASFAKNISRITVSTNWGSNRLYFDDSGFPVDGSGNPINNAKIIIKKEGLASIQYRTINIDCFGNISVNNYLNEISTGNCRKGVHDEPIQGVIVCKADEEIYEGKCVASCAVGEIRINGSCQKPCGNGKYIDNAGKCVDVCPPTFEWNSTALTCECPEGKENYNSKCVPKCTGLQKRDENGVCVNPYIPKEGVACYKFQEVLNVSDSTLINSPMSNGAIGHIHQQKSYNFNSPHAGKLYVTSTFTTTASMGAETGVIATFLNGQNIGYQSFPGGHTYNKESLLFEGKINAGNNTIGFGQSARDWGTLSTTYAGFRGVVCY